MDKKKKNDYRERPEAQYWDPELCPACGNNDFTWGDLFDSDVQKIYYRKGGDFIGQGKQIKARQCTRCGNVQFFAERPQ